jgi:hypothetical protein
VYEEKKDFPHTNTPSRVKKEDSWTGSKMMCSLYKRVYTPSAHNTKRESQKIIKIFSLTLM